MLKEKENGDKNSYLTYIHCMRMDKQNYIYIERERERETRAEVFYLKTTSYIGLSVKRNGNKTVSV